ncbi:class I SAM-dependent methyltransferase [Desulforamulus ruminis]|uniref:class I SAM-dependent methyltransferase n=1 Tax=Desulforamulus ruminis TaxID=1564 RepID=UPI002FD9FEF1
MRIHRIRSYDEFVTHQNRSSVLISEHMKIIDSLVPKKQDVFFVPGYSYTAGRQVQFLVDFQHSGNSGRVIWRERVCCPETGFNNRMRATFHLFDIELEAYPDSRIYITEQITPIYSYFASRYKYAVGSEFLGSKIAFGSVDKRGVRNETLTGLSFQDQSFDIMVCLDVLEHVPDYYQAFQECIRVLKVGGRIMWSVPFVPSSPKNIVRARLKNGEIEHILEPEYHGDPLSQDGVLCFTHFGWEMLDQMRSAGFSDAYALCYHSLEFGYLGGEQFLFVARK